MSNYPAQRVSTNKPIRISARSFIRPTNIRIPYLNIIRKVIPINQKKASNGNSGGILVNSIGNTANIKKSQECSVDFGDKTPKQTTGRISVKSLESLRNVKLKDVTVNLERLPETITLPYKVPTNDENVHDLADHTKVVPNKPSNENNIIKTSQPQQNSPNRQIRPVAVDVALQHGLVQDKLYKVIEVNGEMMLADLDEPSSDVINIDENDSNNVTDTQVTSQNSDNCRKETPKPIQMPKGIAVNYNIPKRTKQPPENSSNGQIPEPVAVDVALQQAGTQEKMYKVVEIDGVMMLAELAKPVDNVSNIDENNSNKVIDTQMIEPNKKQCDWRLKDDNAAAMPTTEKSINPGLTTANKYPLQEVTIISDNEDDAQDPNKKLKIFSTPTNLSHIKRGDPMVLLSRAKYTLIKSRVELLLNKIKKLEQAILENQTRNKENMEEIEKVKKIEQAAHFKNVKLNKEIEILQKDINELTPMVQAFRNNFSEAQISTIMKSKVHMKSLWTDADLEKMVFLRQMISASAYEYIKYQLQMPVPSVDILKKWMIKNNISLKTLLTKKETATTCMCNTKKKDKPSKNNRAYTKIETNADTDTASNHPADPQLPAHARDAQSAQEHRTETAAAVSAIVTHTQLTPTDAQASEEDAVFFNHGDQLTYYLEDGMEADNYIIEYDESGQNDENIQENIEIQADNLQHDYEVQLNHKEDANHDNVIQQDNIENHDNNLQQDNNEDGDKNKPVPAYPKIEQISTVLGEILKTPMMQMLKKRRGAPKMAFNLVCMLCLKPFSSEQELQEHVPIHYFNTFYTTYLQALKPYTCEFCGDMVKLKPLLIKHHRYHLGINQFRCWEEGCQYIAKSTNLMWKHRLKHAAPQLRCQQCPLVFRLARGLREHVLRRHGDRTQHRCQLCGALSRNSYSFWEHMRKHTRPPRIQCPEEDCGQKFYSRRSLGQHKQEAHRAVHRCPHCPLAVYQTEFQLRRHLQRHETQRFSRCATCREMFLDYTSFFHHLKTAHVSREYKCVCNEQFVSKRKYKRHMKACEMIVDKEDEDDEKKMRKRRKIQPTDADSSSTPKKLEKPAKVPVDNLSAALTEPPSQGDENSSNLKSVVNTYSKQKSGNVIIESCQIINPETGQIEEICQNVESIPQQEDIPKKEPVQTPSWLKINTLKNQSVNPTDESCQKTLAVNKQNFKRKNIAVPIGSFNQSLVNTKEYLAHETALPDPKVQINVKIDEKSRKICIDLQEPADSPRLDASVSAVSQPDMPLIDAMNEPQTRRQDEPQGPQRDEQHDRSQVHHKIQQMPQLKLLQEVPKPNAMQLKGAIPINLKGAVPLKVNGNQVVLFSGNKLYRQVSKPPNIQSQAKQVLLNVKMPTEQ